MLLLLLFWESVCSGCTLQQSKSATTTTTRRTSRSCTSVWECVYASVRCCSCNCSCCCYCCSLLPLRNGFIARRPPKRAELPDRSTERPSDVSHLLLLLCLLLLCMLVLCLLCLLWLLLLLFRQPGRVSLLSFRPVLWQRHLCCLRCLLCCLPAPLFSSCT